MPEVISKFWVHERRNFHNWTIVKADIEAAFLEGELKEHTFIKLPMGTKKIENLGENDVGKLERAMYGLAQAARQFYKHMTNYLVKQLGFEQSSSEPCLLKRENVYVGLYVDDLLIFGDNVNIDDFLRELTRKFTIKRMNEVTDFVGCEFNWENDNKSVILHQSKIIRKIESAFQNDIQGLQAYVTPATPGIGIQYVQEDETPLESSKQKKFCSGVGTLLYLVKHSRPDLANGIR